MSISFTEILKEGELNIARACNMVGDANLLFSKNNVLHRK